MGLFTKVFGTYSQRELKSIYPIVDKITALEDEYRQLTDAELQAKTPEFKERLANGETLDDILPEAFAAVREAADRVLGMRPYPVQLVGGIVLHQVAAEIDLPLERGQRLRCRADIGDLVPIGPDLVGRDGHAVRHRERAAVKKADHSGASVF